MAQSTSPGSEANKLPDVLPILPLRDSVLFPYVIVPLSVADDGSIEAVEAALSADRFVMLVAQRDGRVDQPSREQLYSVGTAGMIMRMLKLPDGRTRVLVQGLARARLLHLRRTDGLLQGRVERLEDTVSAVPTLATEALLRSIKEDLEKAIHLGRTISPEVMVIAANLQDPGRLADLAASNLELSAEDAQKVLEILDPLERLRQVQVHLQREIQLLVMQQEISSQAKGEIDRSQREYFLRQQLKAIHEELGEGDEYAEEIGEYRRRAEQAKLPAPAVEELEKQIRRLERSHPDSAESSVIRSYLDQLTSLPWSRVSEDDLDLPHARQVLDEDHYDLEKIKERIIEYLAVRKLNPRSRGPVLCFVGPPGVGKTSLGRSIARALRRRFVRISLGGVRDEAEIRGHRRTYVGAMPGRIIQGLQQAGTSNPVFMLDEIDKLGSDHRGDPSSALLEVLDSEQNPEFRDHYLGVPYDLSGIIFITTANILDPVLPAFLDRMEVIFLSGYTEEDKLEIAHRHLIPKQLRENGLGSNNARFTDSGLKKVIRGYTREAGLRGLEREISSICRKVAVDVAEGHRRRRQIGPRIVADLLGPAKHFNEALLDRARIGVATGLAWTATGGDLLFVEALAVPGRGKLLLTGRLGEVMRESAQAAVSYARAFAARRGLDVDFFAKHDLHIHVPAGSIPKDGPSAGVTVAASILSLLTQRPVDPSIAMSGEITLRGELLPIGGIKEKCLAARAAGIRTVVLPALNRRDLSDVPDSVLNELELCFVRRIDEVTDLALTPAAAARA